MFEELDRVVLAHDLENYNLKAGDIGTVVHCYNERNAFEVEFVTGEGRTIALLTLTKEDIRPIDGKPLARTAM